MIKHFCDFCQKEVCDGEIQKDYVRDYAPIYKGKRLNITASIKSEGESFGHICSKCGFEIIVWLLCPKKSKQAEDENPKLLENQNEEENQA